MGVEGKCRSERSREWMNPIWVDFVIENEGKRLWWGVDNSDIERIYIESRVAKLFYFSPGCSPLRWLVSFVEQESTTVSSFCVSRLLTHILLTFASFTLELGSSNCLMDNRVKRKWALCDYTIRVFTHNRQRRARLAMSERRFFNGIGWISNHFLMNFMQPMMTAKVVDLSRMNKENSVERSVLENFQGSWCVKIS